jgi:Zn-dependent oligopeptidase
VTPEATATLGELPFSLDAEELERRSERALAAARASLDRLEAAPEPRTIGNTLEPLNRLLLEVHNVGNHGRFLFVTHPDPRRRDAGRRVGEAADRFFNEFRLREGTYRALRSLTLDGADPATRHAVEKMLRDMRRAGVELGAEQRGELRRLNDEVDRLANVFAENTNTLVRSIEVIDPTELDGLPEDYVRAHPPDAEGRIRLTTQYPDAYPVFGYATRPELRRRLMMEFLNRAYPENLPVLDRILACRFDLARRLGYPNFAEYIIEDKMMGSTGAARAFIERLAGLLGPTAARYRDRLLARKRRDLPTATALEPWDGGGWFGDFYDTRLRDEEYGVDTKLLREYLPYPRVRDGLLALCERLFDLTFHRRGPEELWDPRVEAYDVRWHGAPLGRFYLDLVPRPGKYNHAAQFEVRVGLEGLLLPQAALVCNFLDPSTPSELARMEYHDVITFFHEFGHLLHSLFSGHTRWLYTTQGFIEWDFVEAPSQLFEEWARDPATLRTFARHAETGAPIPEGLLARLKASESFGRANRWLIQLAASAASLAYYDRDPSGLDTTALLVEVMGRYHPMPPPPGTHFQAAWGHLTGYSALYYTYAWSLVISRDLLGRFHEKGTLTDPETARSYVEEILVPGSGRPANEMVRRFLGREFDFRAFEAWALAPPTPVEGPARAPAEGPAAPPP